MGIGLRPPVPTIVHNNKKCNIRFRSITIIFGAKLAECCITVAITYPVKLK